MKPAQNGTDTTALIAKMITEAEQAAFERGETRGYERGWDEAVAAITAAAGRMPVLQPAAKGSTKPPSKKPPKTRMPRKKRVVRNDGPSPSRKIVFSAIKEHPGLLGSEIAVMVAKSVNKHTVRTQLRKLRLAGEIEQEKLRWYATEDAQSLL